MELEISPKCESGLFSTSVEMVYLKPTSISKDFTCHEHKFQYFENVSGLLQVNVNSRAKTNGFQTAARLRQTPPRNVGDPVIFCGRTGLISIFLVCRVARGFRGRTE